MTVGLQARCAQVRSRANMTYYFLISRERRFPRAIPGDIEQGLCAYS
jgi:hypothetical protein